MNKEMISKIIDSTPDFEDEKTKLLFNLTKEVQEKGFYTKEQALKILKWKSPRPSRHYNKNSNEDFQYVTELALKQKDEKIKIHVLTALTGVKYPAASALLMVYDQSKYPIIDIRVWKQLHLAGMVTENASGQGLTLKQWGIYLNVIQQLARDYNLTARQVEKRLFDYDKRTRKGPLYKKYGARPVNPANKKEK